MVKIIRCQDYEPDDVRTNQIIHAVVCLLTPETYFLSAVLGLPELSRLKIHTDLLRFGTEFFRQAFKG